MSRINQATFHTMIRDRIIGAYTASRGKPLYSQPSHRDNMLDDAVRLMVKAWCARKHALSMFDPSSYRRTITGYKRTYTALCNIGPTGKWYRNPKD